MTPPARPVVIDVEDVAKAFDVPRERVDSLHERLVRPFAHRDTRRLEALRGVSFDVRDGEFFGIVGRNGSGKSTLLKIMASIYAADRGRVRIAGRVAPFIELGVGFNPELSARENVVLNGVLMGLTRAEARSRLGAVLEFAELEQFADLKLKNYSSGMMVRLAFAVMVQADADVMLIDEVLAVGDAAFARKCMEVFRERRAAGRTMVLVTHDMVTVRDLCDRAVVLHEGELRYAGDAEEAARRYFQLNHVGDEDGPAQGMPDFHADITDARVPGAEEGPVAEIDAGPSLELDVTVRARRELADPRVSLFLVNADGIVVTGLERRLAEDGLDPVPAGAHVRLNARVDTPLVPGLYTVTCSVVRREGDRDAMQLLRALELRVRGIPPGVGIVAPRGVLEASLDVGAPA